MKKNIIIYNYSLSGYSYLIKPLIEILKKKSDHYNIVLLHTSSINKDKDINYNKTTTCETIDISYLNSKEISYLLNKYNPIIFVSFGFRSLLDIILFNIAQLLMIKTLFIQHGIFDKNMSMRFSFHDRKSSIIRYINYLKKYSGLIALHSTSGEKGKIISSTIQAIFKNDYSSVPINYAIYYSQSSGKPIQEILNISTYNVYYSGYPLFITTAQIMEKESNLLKNGKPYVLFLHQPFVKMRNTTISLVDEVKIFTEWSSMLNKYGCKLVIKLHPRVDPEEYLKLMNEENIEISDSSLELLTSRAEVIIGMFSTALFYAVYYKKPIFLFNYPEQTFSMVNIFEEISTKFSSTEELSKLLGNKMSKTNYTDFREKYLGENNSFENQCDTILSIINN